MEVYRESGVDICEQLVEKLKEVVSDGARRRLLDSPVVVLLSTKIAAANGRTILQRKAYMSAKSTGEVGAALGIFEQTESGDWGLVLGAAAINESHMAHIEIFGSDLNFCLTRDSAAEYSNLDNRDHRKITLIGAGAVGSHFSLSVARAGVGEWHIIDDDFLLPHNLARHALDPFYLGSAKAEANANVIRTLFQDKQVAKGYVHRIDNGELPTDLIPAFEDTSEIIDASASVPLARRLASDPEICSPILSLIHI